MRHEHYEKNNPEKVTIQHTDMFSPTNDDLIIVTYINQYSNKLPITTI